MTRKTTSRSTSKKVEGTQTGADHSSLMNRVNRIRGQVVGVGRMIESREYCPKILVQTQAAIAALKSLENIVLEGHIKCCVQQAMHSNNQADVDAKLEEIMTLFRKR